jgi:RTX calcium-binding nonapeptide repeat (4 copies)
MSLTMIASDLQSVLETALDRSLDLLNDFAVSPDFDAQVSGIFGAGYDRTQLSMIQTFWQSNQLLDLPAFEVVGATALSGAQAAFAHSTNTIYFSEDFLAANADRADVVVSVLLEEIGHFVDAQLNVVDTPGDEGAIFSAIVRGETLSPESLALLQAEDDAIDILTPAGIVKGEADVASEGNLKFITQYIDDALDAVLGTLKTAGIDQLDLPLIGKLDLASYVSKFVNDTLKQGLISELQKVANAGTAAVRQGLFDALGASGLNLLLDSDGVAGITVNDILLPNAPDSTEFKFTIGKGFTESIDLSDNLGVAGLELDVKGKANVNLGVSLDLHFGVDNSVSDGFFFLKTDTNNELRAQIGMTLQGQNGNPFVADGTLGFLNAKITDQGTQFNAGLAADLKLNPLKPADPAGRVRIGDFAKLEITTPKPSSGADLKFKIDTGISTDGTKKNGNLPSIQADFEALNVFGKTSSIAFKNVTFNAGEFVREFAGDVLDAVKSVTEPIVPVVDTLTEPLPVINNSLLELAKKFPIPGSPVDKNTLDFIDQIAKVVKLVNAIPSGNQAGIIQLGDFQVSGASGSRAVAPSQAPTKSIADQILGIDSAPNPAPNPAPGAAPAFAPANAKIAAPNAKAADSLGSFFQTYNESGLKDGGLAFPILDDPLSVIKILLGDPTVNLFTYTTPKLQYGVDYKAPPIPFFGPLSLTFAGSARVSAQLEFGFDSKGLADFKADGFKNPEKIFDGFYASRPSAIAPNIKPPPNIGLSGELSAKAGVAVGFASLGIGGGIRLGSSLSLYNPSDVLQPFKVRGSDIVSKSPICLFQANGKLEAFIFAEFELDLGFFSISKRLNLADINLIDLEYDPDCNAQQNVYDKPNSDKSPEMKAALKEQGVISYEDTAGNNRIILEHDGGSKGNENINLILQEGTPNATIERYTKVRSILIEGRGESDYIEFRGGVLALGDVQGGNGDDVIITGEGNDYLNGGQGFDRLNGGAGADYASYGDVAKGVTVNLDTGRATQDGYDTQDTLINIENIEGSRFSDRLTGDSGKNVIDGGAGNDEMYGLGGDDVFLSGAGADIMDGGAGTDTITFMGSRDHVYINLSSQRVAAFSEFDNLPFTLAANAGYGAEADGDRFYRMENIQGSIFDDVLVASEFGGTIDGFEGNDFIIAGAGEDDLVASSGIDWLSYRISTAGVEFSLQDGSGAGGYAEDDDIIRPKFQKPGTVERFENLEGSNFSDGELAGDDFNNTIRGLAGNDTLLGLGGDDILEGGRGADSLIGGSNSGALRANTDNVFDGGDTVTYQNASSGVAVNLGPFLFGTGTVGEAAGDTLAGIENLIGSDYGDTLTGDFFDNDLNPLLSSGRDGEVAQIDTVDGGAGRDRLTLIDYIRNDEGIGLTGGFTNVATGTGQIRRGADVVNFTNIERLYVVATGYDDLLTGGTDRDVLLMGAGNDTVNGGGGYDLLDGDDGIDTLSGDFSFLTQNVTLIGDADQENQGTNLSGPNELLIQRFEIFQNITTGDGNDTLTQLGRVDNDFRTGRGRDTINVGLGIDEVSGGFGSLNRVPAIDSLIVDYSVGDTGSGIKMVNDDGLGFLSRDTSDGSGVILDSITFSDIERVEIIGTSKADQLQGLFGDDQLSGRGGDDRIEGGYGDDSIDGGEGDDTIDPGISGVDVVDGGANTAIGDLLVIDYSQNYFARVVSEVNSVNGSSSGRFYSITGAGEFVNVIDEVKFTNIERFAITGAAQDDAIQGGDGNDILIGGGGSDTLIGGRGDDILLGGLEPLNENPAIGQLPAAGQFIAAAVIQRSTDRLTGGSGADTFWLTSRSSSNFTYINDLNIAEGDKIKLSGSQDLYRFGGEEGAPGVVIYFGSASIETAIGVVQDRNITLQAVQSAAVFTG